MASCSCVKKVCAISFTRQESSLYSSHARAQSTGLAGKLLIRVKEVKGLKWKKGKSSKLHVEINIGMETGTTRSVRTRLVSGRRSPPKLHAAWCRALQVVANGPDMQWPPGAPALEFLAETGSLTVHMTVLKETK